MINQGPNMINQGPNMITQLKAAARLKEQATPGSMTHEAGLKIKVDGTDLTAESKYNIWDIAFFPDKEVEAALKVLHGKTAVFTLRGKK